MYFFLDYFTYFNECKPVTSRLTRTVGLRPSLECVSRQMSHMREINQHQSLRSFSCKKGNRSVKQSSLLIDHTNQIATAGHTSYISFDARMNALSFTATFLVLCVLCAKTTVLVSKDHDSPRKHRKGVVFTIIVSNCCFASAPAAITGHTFHWL